MNSENSTTSESHRFRSHLTDKLNLEDPKKNTTLANLNIYYTWKNIIPEYNNNKFKISAPTWNDTFDLPDGSYSIADIQVYFEFIIKKHETLTENSPVQIYPKKSKTELFLKHNGIQSWIVNSWNNEIIKKHKKVVGKDKGAENVPNFDPVEVVLVYCNLVEKDYQHTSKVLFTFVRNKQFGQLINILPPSLTMMNTVNTEFASVELWFSTKVKHLKLKIMSIWQ